MAITLQEAFTGTTRELRRDGRKLEVKIPPGARSGTRVRISGQGESAAQPGDLFLVIDVIPDPRFTRDGDDLHAQVDVDLYTAVLGGEIGVPTPGGPVLLTIPPGSQPGQTFRLKGRGMPGLQQPSRKGDLFAHLQVRLPQSLTAEEKELFQKLASLRPG